MQKIEIASPAKEADRLLRLLQEEELVHIIPIPQQHQANKDDTAYRIAQLQFALEFLKRTRTELGRQQKRSWKDFFVTKPIATLSEINQVLDTLNVDEMIRDLHEKNTQLVNLEATQKTTKERLTSLQPWKNLAVTGKEKNHTFPVIHFLLSFHTRRPEDIIKEIHSIPTSLWQEVSHIIDKRVHTIHGELIVHLQHEEKARDLVKKFHAEVFDITLGVEQTPVDVMRSLERQQQNIVLQRKNILEQVGDILVKERDMQFAYDALLHIQERQGAHQHIAQFPHAVVMTGWIPSNSFGSLQKKLSKEIPETALQRTTPKEGEIPPVALSNSHFFEPFEAVTNIYGKPGYHELDPSPALSIFFLTGFGLALTDAGYGLIMMAGTFAAGKFLRLKKDMRKMVRLLFYAGAMTVVLGALTGGWFGVVLENMPDSFLKNTLLSIKLIDPVAQPMALLGVALAVGVVQLLFAWVVRGYYHWTTNQKKDIFLDDIPWITMVLFLLAWAGTKQGIVPEVFAGILGWLSLANAGYLIVTQGRFQKNVFLQAGSGVLSLYGLIGFLSDTLSYSRLLALGLATGIIGLVVNLIAGMVSSSIPVVGILLAAIVLVIGHTFNLGINALGAFIHSGRLQFVEFFPKFMEGGGAPYKPFGRVGKYVDNPNEFE